MLNACQDCTSCCKVIGELKQVYCITKPMIEYTDNKSEQGKVKME